MKCRAGVWGHGGIHGCPTPPKWKDAHGNLWCDDHRCADRFGTPTGERIDASPDYLDGVREGLRLGAEKTCADLLGLGGTVRKAILKLASDVQKG